jgi:hypothetical protein
MKHLILILITTLFLIEPNKSAPIDCSLYKNDYIDSAKIGIYVNSISGIDYNKGSYNISFYIWATSARIIYDLEQYIFIPNAIEIKREPIYIDTCKIINGRRIYWSEQVINATILQHFDLSRFPFDIQNLNFSIECTYDSPDYFFLELDKNKSVILPQFVQDSKVEKFSFNKNIFRYDSNFGDQTISEYRFNRIDISYQLVRERGRLFTKIFLGLFIVFILGCCNVFLPNHKSQEKFGILIGAVFATVGNKYVTDSMLPINNTLNLSDKVHFLTFFYLFLLSIYAIYEQRASGKDLLKRDTIIFVFSILSYFLILSLMILLE